MCCEDLFLGFLCALLFCEKLLLANIFRASFVYSFNRNSIF